MSQFQSFYYVHAVTGSNPGKVKRVLMDEILTQSPLVFIL